MPGRIISPLRIRVRGTLPLLAVVNMFCVGLGNAKGAFALATARQGSCFIPILFPLAWLLGESGICSVQAVADVLSVALAIPIVLGMLKKIRRAQQAQAEEVDLC